MDLTEHDNLLIAAIADGLALKGFTGLDWQVCYQSRVGPLEWIGPATEDEITRAGQDGVAVVLAPVAFVSEHSETLVELDIEYKKIAGDLGIEHYRRVPTLTADAGYIDGLANLARDAATKKGLCPPRGTRYCPQRFERCLCKEAL